MNSRRKLNLTVRACMGEAKVRLGKAIRELEAPRVGQLAWWTALDWIHDAQVCLKRAEKLAQRNAKRSTAPNAPLELQAKRKDRL